MQGVHESTQSGDDSPRAGLLSPLRAFLLLIVALGAAGLLLSLNRPDAPPPTTTPAAEPDYSLTDAEALTRFRELNAYRIKAYRDRDPSLVRLYVSSQSHLSDVNAKEISQLIDDDVIFRPRIVSQQFRILENTHSRIVIEHRQISRPRFFSENGKEISRSKNPLLEVIHWTISPDSGSWKISDADVVRSRFISKT